MEEQEFVKEVSAPLYRAKGWMQLLGVLLIISGAMYALTIIGIIVAWLPIWLGILLFKAAGAADNATMSGSKFELISSLNSIKTFFIVQGVMFLIGVGLALLFVLMAFIGGMSILDQLGSY